MKQQYFQDYEMRNRYQLYIFVCFLDPKSTKKIPNAGYTFHIPAPVNEGRPGGVGLDDIKHLLESADRDKSFEFTPTPPSGTKPEGRIIGALIRRCMFFIVPLTFSFTKVENNSYTHRS